MSARLSWIWLGAIVSLGASTPSPVPEGAPADKPQNPGKARDQSPAMLNVPFSPEQAAAARAAWAAHLGLPAEFTNSVGLRFVLIPPGRFTLGPNGSTHRVSLERPYYIAVHETTLAAYRRWKSSHKIVGADEEFNADDRPAAMVSWHDAHGFADWLSAQPEERAAGRAYRLPTHAQWQYAARAGTATDRYFGDSKKTEDHARQFCFNRSYTPNPKSESRGRGRQPVGSFPANAFGLHDCLGNVWEWCAERPVDSDTGESRDPIMAGGSWRSGAFHCTAVAHDPGRPELTGDHIGFRMVCTIRSQP